MEFQKYNVKKKKEEEEEEEKGTVINTYVDTHAACWAMGNIVLCLTQESPVFHVIHYSSQFLTLVQYSLLVLLTEPSSFPSSGAFLSFVS